ncbi:MAG: DNA repair protein RecN [Syntrophales bacterium]|jgi:DNA repair protein RecN (Recombination protein N)|nr:DNA repair protein RecN [Syntrophales bacterium]
MLTDLRIKNFAIIGELQISLEEGLTVLTGETGAGKSIVLGALGLVQGDRATPDLIRTDEDEAVVEAVFDIAGRFTLQEKLREMGLEAADTLVLKRIVSRSERNRVFINGSSATLGMLTTLSEPLIDICSQREHQVFLNPDNHIDLLDDFGDLFPLRNEYEEMYGKYQTLREQRRALQKRAKNRDERVDYLTFQLREIDQSSLQEGEEEALREEKKFLTNIQKLESHANKAYDTLYGQDESILEKLRFVQTEIKSINEIDDRFPTQAEGLDAIYYGLEELCFSLRDYCKTLIVDPQRLDTIEERLALLQELKRKYGHSIAGILEEREAIALELNELSQLKDDMGALDAQVALCLQELEQKAQSLSDARQAAARRMEGAMEGEFKTLKMVASVFHVKFAWHAEKGLALGPKGWDQVEFYLSTNVGEALKPMTRIASGGELSRIILAMRRIMLQTDPVATMIFDEVDSGVGGATAEVIGEKLRDLAGRHQILCITHLPQIACFGDHHLRISKAVIEGRTHVRLSVLSDEERVDEIAHMMGGGSFTEIARKCAGEYRRSLTRKSTEPA